MRGEIDLGKSTIYPKFIPNPNLGNQRGFWEKVGKYPNNSGQTG